MIIIKGKYEEEDKNKIDIIKNALLPNLLINLLKNILKADGGKNHIDLISELIKTSGLLAKATFDKNVGIEILYLKTFLPSIPSLMKVGGAVNDILHQTLLINIVNILFHCFKYLC